MEVEIFDADVDLDKSDVVEPDYDPPQQMGDCSVEVTEENQEAAQLAKSMMDAILEGELDKAISHLTEAIVLNPKSAMLYASRAYVFVKLKKPNGAIRDADAALKIDADLGKGYKARGMAKARLGLWEIAAKDLQMASKLDFDEEATMMLKKVESNVKKILELRQKYENLQRERRFEQMQEAHEFASLLKEGLFDVGVESCTKEVLENLPKLEKLRTQIELAPDATQSWSVFDHVSTSSILKSFQSVIVNPTLSSPPPPLLNFGSSLRKLSFSGFGYPWEDMSKIAKLEYLEELNLECYAFRGEKWEAKEMIFPNIDKLLIEDTDLVEWTSGDEVFPQLWKLAMKNCHKLREIPIGYMPHVEHVELVVCNPLAETCIKQFYKDCGVKYSWKEKVKSS